MSNHPPAADIHTWESAYLRFESEAAEIKKFTGRLEGLGARAWPRDAAILDLFSGRGNGLVALEGLGFTRLTGVDLSPRLAAHYHGHARMVVGDCRVLPFAAASFDVAIVQGGLHHLPELPGDLEQTLDDVRRVLKPDGLFVAIEPWLTPFLSLVHTAGCSALGRRLWGKMDALATMIEHERATYEQWLGAPDSVRRTLRDRFTPVIERIAWGKIAFTGRPRPRA